MLWLLRHAEAVDGGADDGRPLTERGARQADAAGIALARLGTHIDVCLTSPKLRAVQTAQRACEPLGVELIVEPRLAGEPFDVHDVLLVGHDPSFSLLLHDLTGAQARMRKGGLAGLNKGELISLLRPSELAGIAR